MKRVIPIWGLILLLLIAAAGGYFFFGTLKVAGPHPHEIPLHPPPLGDLQEQFEGTVQAYGSNRDGDIDKIQLRSDEKEIWLHFPPHTARKVTNAAPVGAMIGAYVGPSRKPVHGGNSIYELISLKNLSSNVEVDLAGIPPPTPSEGIEVEIIGNATRDLEVGSMEGNTFTLSKKQISLPPQMAKELIPRIGRAKIILVRGKMRDSTEGFVSVSGLPVTVATLVKLDSITYKIR